jgi:uncharacterized membrane protein YedE/YeeE
MKIIISYILGVLFSIGLSVSGMVNPDKVLGFLNVFGEWDPALAFVMGGAVIVNLLFFRMVLKRKNPLLGGEFSLPTSNEVDWRLILGSTLFGIGWGLGGICPGPGIANLFTGNTQIIAFIVAMVVGMLTFKLIDKKLPNLICTP